MSPSKAADKTINWKSSDESVVKINSKGEVTVIGGGTATITASTNNGISKSFDLTVDATKRKMKLSVTRKRLDDVNIGDDWSFENKVSGAKAQTSLIVSVGEELTLYSKYTESDENPDIGEASTTHTITEADFNSGFEVTMDVYVTENGGQNRGKSAHFVVTYKFTP